MPLWTDKNNDNSRLFVTNPHFSMIFRIQEECLAL